MKDIENIVDQLKHQRNRLSTRKNYYCVWKQFNQFFIRLDKKPDNWEERLILFVGYLVHQNKKIHYCEELHICNQSCIKGGWSGTE